MKKLYKFTPILFIYSLVSFNNLQALTLKKSVEEAILTNYEISSNNLKEKSDKLDIDIEKSAFKPTLDFSTRLETSDVKNKRDGQATEGFKDETDGYNIRLTLEQLLYDGGKTYSSIREKKSNYKSSFYNTIISNNDIIFNVVKSYNNIIKIETMNKIYELNRIAHDEALEIAFNKEEISGEVLETKKTQALIYALNHKIYTQQIDLNEAYSEFKKLTRLDAKNLCNIEINETKLPKNIKDLISLAFDNNMKIKEQEAKVHIQQEKLLQTKANYFPTIRGKLEVSHDNDIEFTNTGIQETILGEVSINWNFYSGGKDDITTEQNIFLLNREKKTLEKIKLDISEDLTNLYKEFQIIKERISNYKLALNANEEIHKITSQQMEDGTKTFLDLLLAKSKVYDSQIDLLNQEALLKETYFEIIHNIHSLSETILNMNDTECKKPANNFVANKKAKVEEEIDDENTIDSLLEEPTEDPISTLLEEPEENLEEINNTEKIENNQSTIEPIEKKLESNQSQEQEDILSVKEETPEPIPNIIPLKTFEDKLKDIFSYNNEISFDKNSLEATIQVSANSFTKIGLNKNDNLKNILDTISKPLIDFALKNKAQIKNIKIESYTSSEFSKYTLQSDMDKANLGLSQRRANKIKNYFLHYALDNNLNTNFISNLFIADGKGSTKTILNDKGDEDKVTSRRIVFKIDKI